MITKQLLCLLLITTVFTACSKLPYGDGGGKYQEKIVLTSENYLFEGDVERTYLEEEIAAIDLKLENWKIEKTSKVDEREELLEARAELKNRLSQIVDLSSLGLDFPIPCDIVGKCVPVRLGYLVVGMQFTKMDAVVRTLDGKKELSSASLSPLPGFESKLQFLRLPVEDFGKEIEIQIAKRDLKGIVTEYTVIFD